MDNLVQWFSNLSWSTPALHILCLPHLSHLIQLISSLVHCKKIIMGLVIFIKKIKVIIKNSEYISLKKLWFSVV